MSLDFERCGTIHTDKSIPAKESGRSFYVLNPHEKPVNKVQVDGCLVTDDRKRCDYLFEVDGSEGRILYVELKGKDLKKGFEQLLATISDCHYRHSHAQRECYLVVSRVPPAGPKTQVLKKKMMDRQSAPLYIRATKLEVSV